LDFSSSACLLFASVGTKAVNDDGSFSISVTLGMILKVEDSSLKVSSPELLPWEVDGEVQKPEKEFRLQIFPRALNVLTP